MLPSRVDKGALWKEHHQKFNCDHLTDELRERTVRGGSKQFVYQCLRCGNATTNPIKAEAAIAQNGGVKPARFDEGIKSEWDRQCQESSDKITNIDDSAFWKAYEKYLVSPEWGEKRSKVFKRSGGICEGCQDNKATQVHHVTYEHVGYEFLFELVAVCDQCHDKLHEQKA